MIEERRNKLILMSKLEKIRDECSWHLDSCCEYKHFKEAEKVDKILLLVHKEISKIGVELGKLSQEEQNFLIQQEDKNYPKRWNNYEKDLKSLGYNNFESIYY